MTNKKIKVAMLSGGKSAERDVSLNSGRQVADALDTDKYDVRQYDPATDLNKLVQDAPGLDVALIILHGRYGEDGTMQGLLDLLGLPYQGSGVMSSALCMDKRATKEIYRFHGLPVPADLLVDRNNPISTDQIIDRLGLPVVVKPASEGSSLGLSIPKTEADLKKALPEALACGRWVVVEEYIEGREITGGVLGNDEQEALPLIEIIPGEGYEFFDYEAKYKPGASNEICPAPLPEELTRRIQEMALKAHNALYCRGYSRTDFMLRGDDLYVLETNTLPGMTETSLFPQAAAVGGYPFGMLMDKLIQLALEDAENE